MPVRTALIAGSGPEGVNMAAALIRAGISVTLWEPDAAAGERALHFLSDVAGAPVRVTAGFGAVRTADLIVDALQDDRAARVELCACMAAVSADQMALALGAAETPDDNRVSIEIQNRFISFRISQPEHLRKLVEISAGGSVPPGLITGAVDLAAALGKTVVLTPCGRRSIATRLLERLQEAADTLLLYGAIPHELDEALAAFGFDIGPYEAQDLTGLDVAYGERKEQEAGRNPARRYVHISDRMVHEGRLGRKVGVGWYRYPGGGGAVIDPLIEDLIAEEARFAKVPQRVFDASEIQHRILIALIHESASLLEDGTATCGTDVDTVSVCGLGFPEHLGGILQYADSQGAGWVQTQLTALALDDPIVWHPSTAISDCAQRKSKLSLWTRL